MAPTTAFNTNSNGSQTANTMIQRLWKQNRATRASTGDPPNSIDDLKGVGGCLNPRSYSPWSSQAVCLSTRPYGRARRSGARSDQRRLRLNLGRGHVVTFHM